MLNEQTKHRETNTAHVGGDSKTTEIIQAKGRMVWKEVDQGLQIFS